MLLIYVVKIGPRLDYVFKHICGRILGLDFEFTTNLEDFIAHSGPKMSYGKAPLGNEFFVQSHKLLFSQGLEDWEIHVRPWDESVGFFASGDIGKMPYDIFAASFYLLSRYEEYLPHVKDELGRFPYTESLAWKHGFLDQPVVDLWAYKFWEQLHRNFPELQKTKTKGKNIIAIESKRPFEFLNRGFSRTVVGFLSDLYKLRFGRLAWRTQVLMGLRKDPYDTFKWIIKLSRSSPAHVILFFLLGEGYTYRETLKTNRQGYINLIKYVADYLEVGLILSYHWLSNLPQLLIEKQQLESYTHRVLDSSFNDRQRVKLPEVYRNLVEAEISRDYSMYYFDQFGFRGGTCTPFLFYDLEYEVKTPLELMPVVGKTLALHGNAPGVIEKTFNSFYRKVQSVEGQFIMIFSNRDFEPTKHNKIWRYLFSEKLMKRAG
ncbi:MAG TPA: hypothetical protein DCZ44_01530 [Flavobacteriaceae bacterium]|nr:hypothetical protein [Flavobacteriaceae bacterium]